MHVSPPERAFSFCFEAGHSRSFYAHSTIRVSSLEPAHHFYVHICDSTRVFTVISLIGICLPEHNIFRHKLCVRLKNISPAKQNFTTFRTEITAHCANEGRFPHPFGPRINFALLDIIYSVKDAVIYILREDLTDKILFPIAAIEQIEERNSQYRHYTNRYLRDS